MSHPYADTHWDVIVIGAGIGGGSAGRALAEAGKKVLFIEYGKSLPRAQTNQLSDAILPAARLARGLWPQPISAKIDGETSEFFGPVGASVGGSSTFYAGTLERPTRNDLDHSEDIPHPTNGWPTSYNEMRPWFDRATRQFEVYGSQDPLSPESQSNLENAPSFTEGEANLIKSLKSAGLHPYHAHTAGSPDPTDNTSCLSDHPKLDARSAGVEPALATGNAFLLSEARVTRLIGLDSSVQAIEINLHGEALQLTADHFVLAAGAYGSPKILLNSACELWPAGPCNEMDLVGRHIMFHANELYALWPKQKLHGQMPTKAIALRDFYLSGNRRQGSFQSMGVKASYGEIHHYLCQMMSRSRLKNWRMGRDFLRLPAVISEKLFGDAQIFVGLLEDLPYRENRVLHDPSDPDRIQIEYHYHDEFHARRKAFRRAIWKGTKGLKRLPLNLSPQLNFGHPCGSLRSGFDPKTSVINENCRGHSLRNLWVTDASFMPTSMGVNPSLTIAANALRVASKIVDAGKEEL
ncbi:GMC oxidoreductase [Cognatishimia activa]|uniref:GMC oxidoreductase n=1 Tax=Cognatishimia activa TaxID=1715691 RepID=UPI0022318EC7|nr:GMC family oxidoreductase [Cognatishimia activa]UZD91044.1 GMC family oxidoreductase [Cognatishimia activa]